MRFMFIDAAKAEFPIQRLCQVLEVSQSGYFAWRSRPACQRQRDDLVLLAHVRSAFRESNGTYGSPRMTRELQDQGLPIGRRRTARLMRENGLKARQKRRFKRTTDSHHAFPIAPNLLEQDFSADRPNQKWNADISYVSGLCSGRDRLCHLERQALGHPLPHRDARGDLQQGPLQGGRPRPRQAAEDLGRTHRRREGADQERPLRLRHHRRRRGRQHDLPLAAVHLDEWRRHHLRRT